MAAGMEPLVVFWSGRGIHITVVLSFAVQVTLLLLADIRRRADWSVVKVVIWSAYMLADTTAIYALGHLSVVVRLPEHQLMALWAPLLLVHLGGQDNITAYAIEDNRLWLRHLQTFGLQVLAAGYVLYASSILSRPSLLRSAAILMFVVGLLKYGERVWALMGADRFASSSLSATSYKDFSATSQTDEIDPEDLSAVPEARMLVIAYSLLDTPKQMFEGPTHYVKIENARHDEGDFMLGVVEMQLRMMYDLLYTKAAVVHTWYGFFVRVISLPFTVAALQLFHALGDQDGYRRVDVLVTKVLLTGAVILETMSVLRAVFSTWTAVLLYERKWYKLGRVVQVVESMSVTNPMMVLVQRKGYWSDHMRQHDLFKVFHHTDHSIGSKIAKKMGREDLWDSTFYSWSTRASEDIIEKVLELVSTTTKADQIDKGSWGRNALRRHSHSLWKELAWSVGLDPNEILDLDERILVWHIATHVYLMWYSEKFQKTQATKEKSDIPKATKAVCNYMFFLLAARPYMLPYPVTRQRYVQLCKDSINHHLRGFYAYELLEAILGQKDALMKRSALEPNRARDIIGVSPNRRSAQPSVISTGTQGNSQCSLNTTLDRGCQLAAKLIHTAETDADAPGILEMIFEVWVEMLCYTAYWCNEKSHAKNLTNGGELMTTVALMMVYMSNGFIKIKKRGTVGSSSV